MQKLVRNTSVSILFVGLIALNAIYIKNAFLGVSLTIPAILWFGGLLASPLLPETASGWRYFFGGLIFVSFIIIINTAAYLFFSYNYLIFIVTTATILLLSIFWGWNSDIKVNFFALRFGQVLPFRQKIMLAAFWILSVMEIFILLKSRTFDAIRTPWETLPKDFFLIYFLATFLIINLAYSAKKNTFIFLSVFFHFFLTVGVALFIYGLGYGFDPIIHRASEKMILADGVVTPKTLYYIGQYVLAIFLSRVSTANIETIDAFLIPVLYSITLPLVIYYSFKKIMKENYSYLFIALAFLLFPFSGFIATTPQALSNIFTVYAVFISILVIFGENARWIPVLFIFSFASLAIHPLSGIPSLIFSLFALLSHIYKKKILPLPALQKFLIAEFFVLGSIAIPVIFFIHSYFSKNFISYSTSDNIKSIQKISEPFTFLKPYLINNFNIVYDAAYWYENNFPLLVLLIAAAGMLILVKKHSVKSAWMYLWMFFILFINYILLSLLVSFLNLIDYERQIYPNRIREMSFYFLAPIFFYALLFAAERAKKKPYFIRLMLVVFVTLGITSSFYISYPRVDEYRIDKGYNITQADIEAVRSVGENASGYYIVLANQMTSVASIKEFGFKKYYPDKTNPKKLYFYYPVPTGDPLYQYYLKMVYEKPRRAYAEEAAEFIGVKQVYLILNKYWEKYDQLVEQAKLESDDWISIREGEAYVFRFSFEKDE